MAVAKRSSSLVEKRCNGGDPQPQKRRKTDAIRSITTRSMTRASVHNAVFLTTELLEHILSYLPMKDLLLAQRASPKWRAVISQSKQLQQALFFLPREADGHWELLFEPCSSATSAATHPVKLERVTQDEYEKRPGSFMYRSGSLNSMIFRHLLDSGLSRLVDRAEDSACEVFEFCARLSSTQPNASWRKMLVTQPPSDELYTHYGYANRGLVTEYDPFPAGATVADAIGRIEKAEAEGDTVKWEQHFLSTRGMLFPSDEEARMSSVAA
ncbi:hypothetical protein LTR85_011953 [Meristemomyces frigidus]|nr:hypothetical protein LTR85_011953 [Meristemomyces frigidus]